jgi:hypothetical protein
MRKNYYRHRRSPRCEYTLEDVILVIARVNVCILMVIANDAIVIGPKKIACVLTSTGDDCYS